MIGIFIRSYRSKRRATWVASSEFERASERKSPRQQKLRARFQHPARRNSTNSAAWQRTAGRGGARDSSADARGGDWRGRKRHIRNLRTHGVQCVGGTLERVSTQRESAGKRVRAHVSLNRAHPRAPHSDNWHGGCVTQYGVARTIEIQLRVARRAVEQAEFTCAKRSTFAVRGTERAGLLFTKHACERGDLSPSPSESGRIGRRGEWKGRVVRWEKRRTDMRRARFPRDAHVSTARSDASVNTSGKRQVSTGPLSANFTV